jgi:FlaA1/EpsC-like NDP-sugar epimerase
MQRLSSEIYRSFLRVLGGVSSLTRWRKRLVVQALDLVLLVCSTWIAYSLRIGSWIIWDDAVAISLMGAIPAMFVSFNLTGMYRVIFRYVGAGMIMTLLQAFLLYGAFMSIYLGSGFDGVPRTLGVLQPIVFFVLVVGSRLTIRSLLIDVLGRGRAELSRKALIYGAGRLGQSLAASLRSEPALRVTGFVDDDTRLAGQRLDGIRVHDSSNLVRLVERLSIDDVLLALPTNARRRCAEIIDSLRDTQVSIKTLPPVMDIVGGKVSISDVRPLDIEDLLGRDPVRPHELLLGRTIFSKNVLVTGAGGSIGTELCRQIVQIGACKIVLLENSEIALYTIDRELRTVLSNGDRPMTEIVPVLGSVTEGEELYRLLRHHGIETVFHAAAYKHVPMLEHNPLAAIKNNVVGTWQTIEACYRCQIANFILVSTDKAVRPTNIMGATKRAAEQIVQAYNERPGQGRYSMVRFGNVLGSSGSVVPLFRRQIEAGGPVTLTDPRVTRYFMTIPEAASLVIQAGGQASGGEVFVLDMGKPVRIVDLARTMVQLSGLTVKDEDHPDGDIEIVVSGLRPGEKLYEELLIGDEAQATAHPRIMKAHETFLPWSELEGLLVKVENCDVVDEAVALLRVIVPEYRQAESSEPFFGTTQS